jgi:hypothetical protein
MVASWQILAESSVKMFSAAEASGGRRDHTDPHPAALEESNLIVLGLAAAHGLDRILDRVTDLPHELHVGRHSVGRIGAEVQRLNPRTTFRYLRSPEECPGSCCSPPARCYVEST